MTEAMRNSITIRLFESLSKLSLEAEKNFEKYYILSNTARNVSNSRNSIKNFYERSFVSKIINFFMIEPHAVGIFNRSNVFLTMKNIFRADLFLSFTKSKTNFIISNIIKGFVPGSFRLISIVAVIALVVNVLMLLLLRIHIGTLGWILRGCFLCLFMIGVSSKSNMKDIVNTSFVSRLLRKGESVERT